MPPARVTPSGTGRCPRRYRDDQFDLSDALIAIAISLLALTALAHKPWLFFVAMVPTLLGVLMGLAGLLDRQLHPDAITHWLS